MQSPDGDATVEISNFEKLLKKNIEKKPLALYSNKIQSNSNIQPKDVLESVYSQIKTIQLADTRGPKVKGNLKNKSTFLSVNRLPVYNEAQKPNNFETQCLSNTQLINIIDDAEALHQGMTQEFESTFLQPIADNTNQLNIDTKEFDSTFTQTNVDATVSIMNDVIEQEENNHDKYSKKELSDVNEILPKTKVIKPVGTLKELCDQVLESKPVEFISKHMRPCSDNEAINKTPVNLKSEDIEINKSDGHKMKSNDSVGPCEQRCSSPVFKTKTNKVKENLVVYLEDFEKFENIALPLIDIDKDLEKCKHLINSQILEGELCLNAEIGDIFHDDDQCSPILEKSCEIILNDEDRTEKSDEKMITGLDNIKDSRDKRSDSLKDEILFSSDEENDFIYKEFHDLPLTAVLETSFYDHSDVLDKTMLVGFQTANNKSIQISADSFHKAKSILDEDNDCSNFSMKKLVEIYNEKCFSKVDFKTIEEGLKQVQYSSDNQVKENVEDTKITETVLGYEKVVKKPPEKTNFVGFMTASNKLIKIPDKALEISKKVFMDLNLEDNNDLIEQNDIKKADLNIINKDQKDMKHAENDIDDKIDDLLIQEFENIEMSLEEIESKDNTTSDFNNKAPINIEIKAHNESKDNIKDIDYEIFEGQQLKSYGNKEIKATSESTFIGFKTANNKNIEVSAKAMAKTKVIFKDIDTAAHKINDNLNDYENQNTGCYQPSKGSVGCKTAIKRAINLSDAEISISSDNFQYSDTQTIKKDIKTKTNPIELHNEITNNEVIEKVLQWRTTFENDNTAHFKYKANRSNSKSPNNSIMTLPKKSSARMKKLFENLAIKHTDDNEPYNNSKDQINTFKGFQTASKKPVNISTKALQKSKKIFQEVDSYNKANPFEEYSTTKTKEAIERSKRILDFNALPVNDKIISQTVENPFRFQSTTNQEVEVSKGTIENNKNLFTGHDNTIIKDNFKGIQTASNKNVEISNEAIERTKTLLSDIKLLENNEDSTFKGFQTASNKQIIISEKALEKTKTLFNDIEIPIIEKQGLREIDKVKISKEAVEKSKALARDFEIPAIKDKDLSSHQAASHKKLEISNGVFTKKETLFSDIDHPKNNATFKDIQTASDKKVLFYDTNIPNVKELSFKGFQTANNKPVEISKEAIEKSKALFNDFEIFEIKEGFRGFETASNKKIKISEEVLDKTQALFYDTNIPNVKELSFKGFQTANNKPVEISKEAIKKSKALFNDFEISETKEGFRGFETASNKKSTLSEEVLDKTRALFNEIDIPDIKKQSFKGFQTANNKPVEISKEAIEKSKALFKDIDISETKEGFRGFKTSNKDVDVSKEAVDKILFNDIEISDTEQGLGRFQTASNKKVKISEEALKKTKALFNDIGIPENKDVGTFLGFQTGNKKKVTISEQALAKSRQLLQDVGKIDRDNEEVELNEYIRHDNEESCFKTVNNKNTNISKNYSINSIKIPDNPKLNKNTESTNEMKGVEVYNIDNIINTQVLNNFEKSLCTEDFNETPKRNKRSGSPILSCPRAKKRKKFEAPYKEQDKNLVTVKKAIDKPKTVAAKVIFREGYKKNKVITIKDLPQTNNSEKKIDPYILQFNLDNILDFIFEKDRNDLTDNKISIAELKEIFLSAVNKNFVPEGWLDNQLKLILWKLLSYEIKFNFKCTVQSVVDQLKYRYDKELYNAERSAFRKILERDDVATKTMVLCVAGVYVDGASVSSATATDNIELLVTDGWYFIKATIDRMLSKLVADNRIVVGSKIVTSGAELVNCDQGMAPWEDTSAVRLKLSGNSTRPAPWHCKLGYKRAAILSHLSSVKVDGGRVSKLRVFVTRVYPLLYVERFEDGSTVTRSERLEHLHEMKYEADRELMMERICEEVQRELSDQESQDSEVLDSGKRRCYDSGSQIARMMKRSTDPMEFRAQLTSSQIHLLQDHTSKTRQKIMDTIQQRIQDRLSARNVVTLARGRIVENVGGRVAKGMLSIWKPNEAVLELFKEGATIEIMNAMPTAMRYSELQITAGRQTMFRQIKSKDDQLLQAFKRKCYRISEIADNPSMNTEYSEIDTAGIVFLIEPSNEELKSNNNFQNVYLADYDKNIISINFWGGIKKFGFENILDTGQIVACANLQKRAGNTRKNIPQFRVTEFSSFTKTPRNIQARDIVDELDKKMYGLDRRKFCDDCVAIKNNYIAIRCLNNNENESPCRFNISEYSFTRNKMFIDTPIGVKTNKNEDANLNLTGLDFESSFKRDTQDLSPNTLQRKKKVNEKIARLKMYGEPPPLSPINIINKSINAKNSYKSPLTSANVATPNLENSVAVVNNLPEDSPKAVPRSPVISRKRTYVKSVPVKLNFTEDKSESVDHFADDFDASPPLSLD